MTKKTRDFRRDKRAYYRHMRFLEIRLTSHMLISEVVGQIGYKFIDFITEETAKLSTLTEKTL